jgi:hypothetical protein
MQISGMAGRRVLVRAIATALGVPSAAFAGTITADGVTCTLANAINSANADSAIGGCSAGSGVDTIQVAAGPAIAGSLPTVISDINFVPSGMAPVVIDGGSHQIFRIGDETHAPTVTFSSLIIAGGVAQGGGASSGGGAGAGMGGAIFIYDGAVSIDLSTLSENGAAGGTTSGLVATHSGGGGGGGMSGGGGTAAAGFEATGGTGGTGGAFGGGGGGGGNTYTSELGGGTGGDGGGTFPGTGGTVFPSPAFPSDGGFGGGGGGGAAPSDTTPSQGGASGGFGGGGGGGGGSGPSMINVDSPGPGGNGGFGGGGGAGGSADSAQGASGSLGGFGGGGGSPGYGTSYGGPGQGGFGGGDTEGGGGGGGAGFGAAIFIRSGHLEITNTQVAANSVQHGNGPGGSGLAKGAGIFAVNMLTSPNGNNQGMPATLPQVTGCAVTFSFNNAADAGTSNRDNADVFGADRLGLTLACGDRIFADGLGDP